MAQQGLDMVELDLSRGKKAGGEGVPTGVEAEIALLDAQSVSGMFEGPSCLEFVDFLKRAVASFLDKLLRPGR